MRPSSSGMFVCAIALGATLGLSTSQAATEKVIYSFCGQAKCADGANPYAGVLAVNGKLYGVTFEGGTGRCDHNGCGTIFSFDPATGTETVLHSFLAHPDGHAPLGNLIDVKGTLYGTTSKGGNGIGSCPHFQCGTVFSLDTTTGSETVLYSFCSKQSCADGAYPWGALLVAKNALYGMTTGGGANGYGTVFALDPASGAETVLHAFAWSDGAIPLDGLISVNGVYFGTAEYGGDYGYGAVISFDPSSGTETVLHSFQGNSSDGGFPESALVDVKGTLYGTTYSGGASNAGTIFSIDPNTDALTLLYSFAEGFPAAGLISAGSRMYGTTQYDGAYKEGTVFSFDPSTRSVKVLHSFGQSRNDGRDSVAGLIDVHGTLYGTTAHGGASHDAGTIFSIAP